MLCKKDGVISLAAATKAFGNFVDTIELMATTFDVVTTIVVGVLINPYQFVCCRPASNVGSDGEFFVTLAALGLFGSRGSICIIWSIRTASHQGG